MSMLSIVIPVYNGGKYISHCLDDLQRQTFTDWEAIFVNDGSTDDTKQVLEHLVAPHERCRVIHKENGGTAQTRNAGMDVANGKYITFLDVDDELDPQMYEALVRMMEETGADLGICGYYYKVEREQNGVPIEPYLEPKSYPDCVLRGRDAIREKLVELWDRDMLYNVWNKVYRMELIREKHLRYRDGHVYTEDCVFNRAYIENCESIAMTDRCLYYYVRERAGSTSEKYRKDYFEIRQKEYVEFQAYFKAMDMWNDEAREYVCREFIERIAGCIENFFHAEKRLPEKEKKALISKVISHPDVREALKYARCRSKKMRILVLPIKLKNVEFTYLTYKAVYLVHKSNPTLFHKLRNRR